MSTTKTVPPASVSSKSSALISGCARVTGRSCRARSRYRLSTDVRPSASTNLPAMPGRRRAAAACRGSPSAMRRASGASRRRPRRRGGSRRRRARRRAARGRAPRTTARVAPGMSRLPRSDRRGSRSRRRRQNSADQRRRDRSALERLLESCAAAASTGSGLRVGAATRTPSRRRRQRQEPASDGDRRRTDADRCATDAGPGALDSRRTAGSGSGGSRRSDEDREIVQRGVAPGDALDGANERPAQLASPTPIRWPSTTRLEARFVERLPSGFSASVMPSLYITSTSPGSSIVGARRRRSRPRTCPSAMPPARSRSYGAVAARSSGGVWPALT